MKTKFEIAQIINKTGAPVQGIDRVYVGNEFCEKLLPSIAGLRRLFVFAGSRHKAFTFVAPFVTNTGMRALGRLLSFLNDQHNVEVVFNDWGVLKLIKEEFRNLTPVLGRLLTKQRRDPRMAKIFSPERELRKKRSRDRKNDTILFKKRVPRSLFVHHQSSVINLPLFQEYLLAQDIKRVEIDNLVWDMNIQMNKNIGVSIYLPYGYIATTRMCGKLTLTYAACKKECEKFFFRVEDESSPVPFYSIGNTLFYKSPIPPDRYLEKLGIDRIVYQSRLPY